LADRPGRIDYHVEIGAHYYSFPHRFARTQIEARLTVRTVEIFVMLPADLPIEASAWTPRQFS
jgi:hypothetical protein